MNRLFLIPAKPLARAKQRLAEAYPPADRTRLVLAMLEDVAAAATGAGPTWVLGSDAAVADAAVRRGATPVRDVVPDAGLNASLVVAIARARDDGFGTVVVVASDLPCTTSDDLAAVPASGVGIAPSADGTGTNVLALTPPEAIVPAFGRDSRLVHERLAREAGIDPLILDSARLAADVDTADDLARAIRVGVGRATAEALEALVV